MKTIICLVRHGMTDWNKKMMIQGRKDIPLNEEGIAQVLKTASRLKDIALKWDVYFSSPLNRALESCKIIKNYLDDSKADIIIRPNLTEREFGSADGLTITNDVYQKILNNEYLGMEKASDVCQRAMQEITSILNEYQGKNILIVTHSHFIKALFTIIDPNLTFHSKLNNASLNFIEFEDQKIVSFHFNQ